jgi:hypothetical protein
MKLWNDGGTLPLEMTTAFPSLPVQLVIASVAAALLVPDHQGIVTYIFVGELGCPLESSCPRLALSPVVSPSLQAINTEGWAIQPFIVVAGRYHLANWYRESNVPGDSAIATTQNGWTDNETGLECIKHFNRYTTNRSTSWTRYTRPKRC